jgi:hypothetical protein
VNAPKEKNHVPAEHEAGSRHRLCRGQRRGRAQGADRSGYGPKYAEPDADPSEADAEGHTVESVRAQLDAAGIAYDKRLGLAKLIALLPA